MKYEQYIKETVRNCGSIWENKWKVLLCLMSDSVVQSHLAILLSPASLLLCVSWQIYDLRGPLRLSLHLPTFLMKHITLTMLHCNACSMLQCWTLRFKKSYTECWCGLSVVVMVVIVLQQITSLTSRFRSVIILTMLSDCWTTDTYFVTSQLF